MKGFALLALVGWLAIAPATAQQRADATQLSDAKVRQAIILVLRNIHKAQCGESKCAATTAEEVANPPLPIADARTAINTGVLSGTAQWCELDWKRELFAPMMERLTKDAQADERRRALVALLHGIYQGQVYMSLQPRGACPANIKAQIQKRIAGS